MTKLRPGAKRIAPFALRYFGLVLVVSCVAFNSIAQTNSAKVVPPKPQPSHRYLLVVETSAAMERRMEGVKQAVQALLLSGMRGQMRRGDTIGLWTFNEELYAGQFPLQRWSPENRQRIATSISAFLQKQSYQKRARPDVVIQALSGLIKDSEAITVLLISDGEEKIQGTPHDAEINETYKGNSRYQKKMGMPFITVLRAHGGAMTGYTVNMAPWPVEFPPLPPEPRIAAEEKVPAAPAAKPPPVAQPLIFSGRKPAETPKSGNEAVEKASPTPAAATSEAKTEAATAKPENRNAPTPPPEKPSAAESSRAESTAKPPEVAPSPPKPATQAAVGETVSSPGAKSEPTGAPRDNPAERKATPPDITGPPAAQQSEPAPAPSVANTGSRSENPAPPGQTKTGPAAANATPERPSVSAVSSSTSPPAQSAVATPPQSFLSRNASLIIGCVLLVAAAGVWVLMVRRSRSARHGSLITRSFDQKEK